MLCIFIGIPNRQTLIIICHFNQDSRTKHFMFLTLERININVIGKQFVKVKAILYI